jgi:hypothetical protein
MTDVSRNKDNASKSQVIKKPPGHSTRYNILVAYLVIASVILIIFFSVAIYLLATTGYWINAFSDSINNNNCGSIPSQCQYYQSTPPTPTSFPTGYNPVLAKFALQLVSNFEQNFSQGLPSTSVGLFGGLTLIKTLQLTISSTPLFGYLALDATNSAAYVIIRGNILTLPLTLPKRHL